MAHSDDTRRAVRAAYVFDQVALAVAASSHEVPEATAKRWQREARAAGDDWDKARGAQMMAGGGVEDAVRQTIGTLMQQAQSTLAWLNSGAQIDPLVRVQSINGLGDTLAKVGAVLRGMPSAGAPRDAEARRAALQSITERGRALVDERPDDEDAVLQALVRMVQEKLFSAVVDMEFEPASIDLPKLTRSLMDLTRTTTAVRKSRQEIRDRAGAAALDGARAAGLSDEAAEMIRQKILGVV